mgnify:CR=1 FL=1
MTKLFFHWTLDLPFCVLLVHNVAYETREDAEKALEDLPEVYKDFRLRCDDEIAGIKGAHILSVPLKRS